MDRIAISVFPVKYDILPYRAVPRAGGRKSSLFLMGNFSALLLFISNVPGNSPLLWRRLSGTVDIF